MPSTVSETEELARLAADDREIRALLSRYCRAIDRFDMDLLRTVYHPDAYDDHGGYKGDVGGFVRYLHEVLPRFTITQHFLGTMHIELDGDVAHTETYCQAFHRIRAEDGAESDHVAGLRYVDRLERRAGEWRIARRQIVIDWSRTDPVLAGGGPPGPETQAGQRDRTDPVYHFGR